MIFSLFYLIYFDLVSGDSIDSSNKNNYIFSIDSIEKRKKMRDRWPKMEKEK